MTNKDKRSESEGISLIGLYKQLAVDEGWNSFWLSILLLIAGFLIRKTEHWYFDGLEVKIISHLAFIFSALHIIAFVFYLFKTNQQTTHE